MLLLCVFLACQPATSYPCYFSHLDLTFQAFSSLSRPAYTELVAGLVSSSAILQQDTWLQGDWACATTGHSAVIITMFTAYRLMFESVTIARNVCQSFQSFGPEHDSSTTTGQIAMTCCVDTQLSDLIATRMDSLRAESDLFYTSIPVSVSIQKKFW